MIRLAERFRLLLLTFPRHYRRSRGAEMLATLLDGSLPGQQWPTLRSALSVVWSGIRCRFRLRPGKFSWVAAAATTLAGAVLGATLGTWMAWNMAAGPLPSDSEADAIARSIMVAPPHSRDRYDFIFGSAEGLGMQMPGGVWYLYKNDEQVEMPAQATQTLGAHGWAVSSQQCWDCAWPFSVAVKGDTRVAVGPGTIMITRATPSALPLLMAIGALLGAYGGWMLTARTGRLLARRTQGQKTTLAAGAAAGFLMLLPALYYTVGWNILYYIAFDFPPDLFARAPFWILSWEPVRNLTFSGLAAILLAMTFAELPPRRESAGQSITS